MKTILDLFPFLGLVPLWVWISLGVLLRITEALFVLWVFFLAVMKLQDLDKSGELAKLHISVRIAARTVLIIGVVMNAFCRVCLTSVLFVDPPRWGEWGVSAQVKRLWTDGGWWPWQKRWAIFWRDNVLGPFDATKRHS